LELEDFWEYLYVRTYPFAGDTQQVCRGNELADSHIHPQYSNFKDWARAQYGEEAEEEEIKPSKHYVTLPQDRDQVDAKVTAYREEPEVSYETRES
jgi:hypothetical protein